MPGRLDTSLTARGTTGPGAGGVPEAVRQAALGAFDQRLLGAVILDLVYDSAVPDGYPDPLPAEHLPPSHLPPSHLPTQADGQRSLRFDGRPSGVEAQVSLVLGPEGHEQRLTIWVTPPRTVPVEVRWSGGAVSVATSGEGRAATALAPRGLISLVLRSAEPDQRLLQTAWVRV